MGWWVPLPPGRWQLCFVWGGLAPGVLCWQPAHPGGLSGEEGCIVCPEQGQLEGGEPRVGASQLAFGLMSTEEGLAGEAARGCPSLTPDPHTAQVSIPSGCPRLGPQAWPPTWHLATGLAPTRAPHT